MSSCLLFLVISPSSVSRLSHHFLPSPTPFLVFHLSSLVSVSHLSSSLSIGLYTCTIIPYLRTVTISPHPKHSHHRILSNILSPTHFTTLPHFFSSPIPPHRFIAYFHHPTIPSPHHPFFQIPHFYTHTLVLFFAFLSSIPPFPFLAFISSRALVLNSVIPSPIW